jgi:hypothetical protein
MGWAAGSELGEDIWLKIREYIPEENREEVAKYIYDSVCDLDADDWDGSSQLEIDAKLPVYCWSCDEEFTADELNEDHLCKDCEDE